VLPPAGLALWMAATIGHFLLTASWVGRLAPARRTRDERWFQATLAGIGTLSLVIHVLLLTTGLTLMRGLAALVSWHAALAVTFGPPWRAGSRGQPRVDPPAMPDHRGPAERVETWLEACAAIVLAGIGLAWILNASGSFVVSGTDATHYHVPTAVNLSLGAGLFDLPATQHLYPMGASALVAWFILPTGGPLLVDLSMLPYFLLLAASVAWIFRLATGASGLAWTTWWMLALFGMPLFRQASLVSADLPFAASFAALLALVVALSTCRPAGTIDILLAGLAAGLLVGSKTTGAAAAVILGAFGLAALPFVRRSVRGSAGGSGRSGVRQIVLPVAGAVVIALGAGGVWIVRNWWLFGSPIAPSGLTLLGIEIFAGEPAGSSLRDSVLEDWMRPGYSLTGRMAAYTSERLGSWYLALLLPAVLVPVDVLRSRVRRTPDPTQTGRLLVWVLVMATGAALGWLLIGAPWTSLERSRGLSLRYLLPFAALLPCLAAIGVFSASVPWYRRARPAAAAGVAVSAAGLALLWFGQGGGLAPPRLDTGALGASLALFALAAMSRRGASRLTGVRRTVAGLLLVFVLSTLWAGYSEARAGAGLARRERQMDRSDQDARAVRALYLAAVEAERRAGGACESRRFLAFVRVDTPLDLQGLDYRNQVFYAGRDVELTARAAPIGACDYIITSRGLLGSDKGRALVEVLSLAGAPAEIAAQGSFVLLASPQ
jgi:hypothetical protein